jgi:hypothetical protein
MRIYTPLDGTPQRCELPEEGAPKGLLFDGKGKSWRP